MATKETNLILVILFFSFFIICVQASTDTILQGQQLRDSEYLFSADGFFRLGFFSPGRSEKRYLGLFFNIPDIRVPTFSTMDRHQMFFWHLPPEGAVWVANRNTPIPDESGILVIDEYGKMKISYGGGNHIELSSVEGASNASATLLDSGNLVLREMNLDGSTKRILWQSFDYPTDTLLPGMKLGINFKTGHTWSLTSWISDAVPAQGTFTLGVGGDPNGTSQLIIWWQGKVYWTSGIWLNGNFEHMHMQWSPYGGSPNFSYISNENETSFTFTTNKKFTLEMYKMTPEGTISDTEGRTSFAGCSPYRHNDSPYRHDDGCVEQKLPQCRKTYNQFYERGGFVTFDNGIKFDASHNLSSNDCEAKCRNNCSCVAYASINDNGTGCELWSRVSNFKLDYRDPNARHIYVLYKDKEHLGILAKWLIAVPVFLVIPASFYLILRCKHIVKAISKEGMLVMATVVKMVVGLGLVFKSYRAKIKRKSERRQETLIYEIGATSRSGISKKLNKDGKKSHDLRFFSFKNIASATDNFAPGSKLGEGGYGPVYKGKLQNGQEIAIKRLSRSSGQGIAEFKNELTLIARLQHTNLVRLLGCCIQREEKMLIYEYMPNKSLDFFLFDPMRRDLLDWEKRFHIIQGVAQGLLYLHKYSRLRIIHRDLKAGNILLDEEMNPKISILEWQDYLSRVNLKQTQTELWEHGNGYMPPEYAMDGICSMKSDVFSFGILLLEIVSGRKNNSYYHPDHPLTLTGHAWELWKEGRCLELLDPTLGNSYHNNEVSRCIHVGLLCAQDSPSDRPSMSDVAAMISYENIPLSAPKQPAFFINRSSPHAEIVEQRLEIISSNRVTITEMEAR